MANTTLRYTQLEVVGVTRSDRGFAEATDDAIADADAKFPGVSWYEVVELSGRIEQGKRGEFWVRLRLGWDAEPPLRPAI